MTTYVCNNCDKKFKSVRFYTNHINKCMGSNKIIKLDNNQQSQVNYDLIIQKMQSEIINLKKQLNYDNIINKTGCNDLVNNNDAKNDIKGNNNSVDIDNIVNNDVTINNDNKTINYFIINIPLELINNSSNKDIIVNIVNEINKKINI